MNKAPTQPPAKNSAIVPAVVIAVLVIVAALGYKGYQWTSPVTPAQVPDAGVYAVPAPQLSQTQELAGGTAGSNLTPASSSSSGAGPEAAPVDSKELVGELAALDGKTPITPEQAQKWKESLQLLIRRGAASIPAIQEFMTQNKDANYAGVSGADALGYKTLRAALLDALAQIGGPDSVQTLLQIMQSSIFPTDIATIAKTLDSQGPGEYQQAILDAVRQQLHLGALDPLAGANVLPLFQVLANEAAGGANVSAELVQYAEKWPYYSAITLASLPDGAGVPGLIQIAQGAVAGDPSAAAQSLAQLAPQNPDALKSLLDMAKGGQLNDTVLVQLAPILAGRDYQLGPPQDPSAVGYMTFHLASGNQDFSAFDASGAFTQEQIAERIFLIDQFLEAVPSSDSAAQDALQAQRAALMAKQNQ